MEDLGGELGELRPVHTPPRAWSSWVLGPRPGGPSHPRGTLHRARRTVLRGLARRYVRKHTTGYASPATWARPALQRWPTRRAHRHAGSSPRMHRSLHSARCTHHGMPSHARGYPLARPPQHGHAGSALPTAEEGGPRCVRWHGGETRQARRARSVALPSCDAWCGLNSVGAAVGGGSLPGRFQGSIWHTAPSEKNALGRNWRGGHLRAIVSTLPPCCTALRASWRPCRAAAEISPPS